VTLSANFLRTPMCRNTSMRETALPTLEMKYMYDQKHYVLT
jgi:hypothetical protein